jgi:beta-lactamase regulating signal transducer with metallopeptidase domain
MDALTRDAQTWLPLLDAAVKSTLVLLAAGLVTLGLRRSSAAVRHLVWTSALGAALVLPAIALALPRWQAPVLTLAAPSAAAVESPSTPSARASQPPAPSVARQRAETAATSSPAAAGSRTAPVPAAWSWTAIAALVWAAGAALILARLLLGIAAVHVLARRSRAASAAAWLPLAREIAGELGVARVSFRRADGAAMPMAWGIFRPVVLMPADADTWPEPRLRIVLMHELAHVKRADCLTHLLAQAACAVYWMNPLAWLAARRARTERERACDDLVLSRGTRGSDYAGELVEIARTIGRDRTGRLLAGASLAMAHRSQLEGRLMSILDPTVPRTGVSRLRASGVTILAFASIVPLATMQTWAFEDERAMLPRVQANPRPAPAPKPIPAPNTETTTPKAFRVDGAAVPQNAVQASVQEAIQGSAQGAAQGLLEGMIQGIAQGVTEGVGEAIAQGVSQGVGRGAGRGSGSGQSDERKAAANPKLIAALTEALKDSDKEVREAAMHALVQMRAPAIFEPLVQALKDPSADMRERAAFGLGQLDDKRAVAPLTAALKDASASVREQAAFALGQLDDPAAVSGLLAALKDESASVREQVVFALGQLDAAEAVEPLIAALKDANGSVKEQAAFALGQIGDSRATDALIALLKDPNAQVRQQAAFALSQIR